MPQSPFAFEVINDPKQNTLDNLVFEIEETSNLEFFKKVSLPEDIAREIETKSQEVEKSSFCISTYFPLFGAKKIHILYIHDKTAYTKELADLLKKIDGDIAFYTSRKDQIFPIMDTLLLTGYQFDQYLSKKKPRKFAVIHEAMPDRLRAEIMDRMSLLSSIYLVRDMVNTPASLKYPRRLAEQMMKLPFRHTKVTLMDKKELEIKGFNLLLAVGAGSDKDSCVLVFERMIDKNLPTYALAGKGLTFDAGGLQIKPDTAMLDMKSDMAGAAVVAATLLYLDAHDDLRCNIIAAVGLAENMLGGNAMKPLDIIKAHNGKTVEIGHTDAE